MKEYEVTSADGHKMTVLLDEEAAEARGLTSKATKSAPVEEHAVAAKVETATPKRKTS